MKRVKVFLGGYINQTNAQNLNCRELAIHIDKGKFEVFTLAIKHGNLGVPKLSGVNIFKCFYPVKISGLLGYLWGFYKADVVYLPRADFLNWQFFLLRISKRKSFKTIENIIDEVSLKTALSVISKKLHDPLDYYKFCDQNHPITRFVGEYNYRVHRLSYDLPILHVPTDTSNFVKFFRLRTKLKKLVFIGNDFTRKRLIEFLELANEYPNLSFLVIGKGDFAPYKAQIFSNNVEFLGSLNRMELTEALSDVDLHFFPSKSEGFGKVTIECAALGIPSIVYDTYGAGEWIRTDEGIVVSDFSEVKSIVGHMLNDNCNRLATLSRNCCGLANRFSSESVVPQYEKVIQDLYAS
jgi:glycosyltransferase involved in cell wall biosynthesis